MNPSVIATQQYSLRSKISIKLFLRILKIQSYPGKCEAMTHEIINILKENNISYEVDWSGNVTAIKGTGKGPCFVAHMDTIHPIRKIPPHIKKIGNCLFAICPKNIELVGIGGDDKCGIYAALHFLIYGNMDGMAVFTVDEEAGCVGAANYNLDKIRHCHFLLQADRNGNSEIITRVHDIQLCSHFFEDKVRTIAEQFNYPYPFYRGNITDVVAMVKNGVGISAINVAAGYYRPHTSAEYINLADFQKCISFMMAVCETLGNSRWEHNHINLFL